MKRIAIFVIVLSTLLFPQTTKIAIVTDSHIGYPNADQNLLDITTIINNRDDIDYAFSLGDITELGMTDELFDAHGIYEEFKVPYEIIPGNHDTKWCESGGMAFKYLWDDNKFIVNVKINTFIGLNSGVSWRGAGGHYTMEDVRWLDSVVATIPDENNLFFMGHHQMDHGTDNWFKITNILRTKNIKAIFVGHGHRFIEYDFNGIPGFMSAATVAKLKFIPSYLLLEISQDSISLTKGEMIEKEDEWVYYHPDSNISYLDYDSMMTVDNFDVIVRLKKTPEAEYEQWISFPVDTNLTIPKIDSTQFIDYHSLSDWHYEAKSNLVNGVIVKDNKIYAAFENGEILCLDSDGDVVWKKNTDYIFYNTPEVIAEYLFVGSMQGELLKIEKNSGEIVKTIEFKNPISSPLVTSVIEQETGSVTALFAGTSEGELFCINPETLETIWKNDSASAMIESKPLIKDDAIIFGCWDEHIYNVNIHTGELNWKWTNENNFYYSPAACSPVANDEMVFVCTPEKKIYAIDLESGKLVWLQDSFPAWETLGINQDGTILASKGIENVFGFFNAADGSVIKEVEAPTGVDTAPVIPTEIDGNFYIGAKNGHLYRVTKEYSVEPVVFTGTARTHTIKKMNENTIIFSNMDGTITKISLNK